MTSSRLVPIIAAAAFAAAPATAQEPGGVPHETVAGLFAWSDVDVRVGRLPDRWIADLPLPWDGRLLGSYEVAQERVVAVAVEGSAVTARNSLVDRLVGLGWTAEPPAPTGGFVWRDASHPVTLCRGEDRLLLTALPQTRQNVLRIRLIDEMKCSQAPAEPTPQQESPLPTLLAPEHTTMTGKASLLGYGIRGFAATMLSETPLPELLADLLGQLHRQGWSEVDRALGRDGAIVSLRRDGVAAALSGVRGAAGDFLVEFRVIGS
jgi:hypothetical protein